MSSPQISACMGAGIKGYGETLDQLAINMADQGAQHYTGPIDAYQQRQELMMADDGMVDEEISRSYLRKKLRGGGSIQ